MNEEVVVEEKVESADAGLSAGFNKVRGTTEEATPVAVQEEPPAAEPEPEPVPEPLSQDELRAAISKLPDLEQFKGQTATDLQKLHGKIGEFNRTLQSLQAAPSAVTGEAHKAALQKLTDEYPELAQTIAPLFEGRGGVSTEQIGEMVQQQVGQIKADTQQTISELKAQIKLTKAHPDWEDIPATPEYTLWMKTKTPEFQKEFNETWDTGFVATSLTEFKTWRDTTYAKTKEKQTRLEGAVTPAGVPSRSQGRIPDTAGLSAGFRRVRKS